MHARSTSTSPFFFPSFQKAMKAMKAKKAAPMKVGVVWRCALCLFLFVVFVFGLRGDMHTGSTSTSPFVFPSFQKAMKAMKKKK